MNESAEFKLRKIDLAQFGNLFRQETTQLTDQELLSMDFILHRAWSFLREGHEVFTSDGLWNFKDLLGLHTKVLEEMNQRGFIHAIKDELFEQTPLPSEPSESIPATEKIVSGDEMLTKGLIAEKEVEEFPNLVFSEEGAVEFVRKGKASASTI